ncbi:hypothetical protein CHISP_2215 [Chitinispirillum alkaliphilum]|nr:hypothetical protein CHISP_2215 [Chitinispirillum alkaliphilum]
MNDCRYTDFLNFALKQILETANFYAQQAKMCTNHDKKLYLYYLAGKKRVQFVQVQLDAKKQTTISNEEIEKLANTSNFHPIASTTLKEIRTYAKEKAQKDLKLFSYLSTLEEDPETKKLLLSLSRQAKQYLKDVSGGYSSFRSEKGPYHHKCSILAKLSATPEVKCYA